MTNGKGDCPHCQGDGYLLCVGGPGYFSERFGNWLPSESYERCPCCFGSGSDVEVMADREEELRDLTAPPSPPDSVQGDPDADLPF